MTYTWGQLALDTVKDPRSAAHTVLSVKLSRQELYMGIVICAAFGTILNTLFVMYVLPLIADELNGRTLTTAPPFTSFIVSAGSLILTANILTWVGRAMGGSGRLHDMMQLMIWQQLLLIALQGVGFLIMVASPVLASLYILAMFAFYIRIVLHFVDIGHDLNSLGAAFGILFVTLIGLVLGLVVLSAVTGLSA